MEKEKQKRLEAAGWIFGDAEDFLELTTEERHLVQERMKNLMSREEDPELPDAFDAVWLTARLAQKAFMNKKNPTQEQILHLVIFNIELATEMLKDAAKLGSKLTDISKIKPAIDSAIKASSHVLDIAAK